MRRATEPEKNPLSRNRCEKWLLQVGLSGVGSRRRRRKIRVTRRVCLHRWSRTDFHVLCYDQNVSKQHVLVIILIEFRVTGDTAQMNAVARFRNGDTGVGDRYHTAVHVCIPALEEA